MHMVNGKQKVMLMLILTIVVGGGFGIFLRACLLQLGIIVPFPMESRSVWETLDSSLVGAKLQFSAAPVVHFGPTGLLTV